MRKFQAFIDWIKQGFRREPLPAPGPNRRRYISGKRVREIQAAWAKKMGPSLTGVYRRVPNVEFYLPSVQYGDRIMEKELRKNRKYVKDVGDCNDFSWMMKAAFVEDAWRKVNGKWLQRAPHCVGVFDYDPKGPGPGHSITWMIDDREVFRLIESQTGKEIAGSSVNKIFAMIA